MKVHCTALHVYTFLLAGIAVWRGPVTSSAVRILLLTHVSSVLFCAVKQQKLGG